MVDPSEFATAADDMGRGLGGSRHGTNTNKGRSLGFRAKVAGKGGMESMNAMTVGTGGVGGKQTPRGDNDKSRWATLLTPPILFDNTPTRYVQPQPLPTHKNKMY